MLYIGHYPVIYIPWNLLLAYFPLLIVVYLLDRFEGENWKSFSLGDKGTFIVFFIVWFFFYPNAAYTFTDIRHLLNYCPPSTIKGHAVCIENAWMIAVFFVYAFAGIPSFVLALKKMTKLLKEVFQFRWLEHYPLFMLPLTAMGVLIGLIERWNTWDLLLTPQKIIYDSWLYITDDKRFVTWLTYTAALFIVYYGTLWMMRYASKEK